MGYLIFSALVVLMLCCRGSGTCFAAVTLIVVLILAGAGRLPPIAILAAMILVFSGPLAAMLATPFLGPLFSGGIPPGLRALLISAGYLFMLECPYTWISLQVLSGAPGAITMGGLLMLIGDVVMGAMLVAGLALSFVALIELPFAWIFRGRNVQTVSWLSGMRPVLLVFFVALSMSQVASYFTDLLEQTPDRLVSTGDLQ